MRPSCCVFPTVTGARPWPSLGCTKVPREFLSPPRHHSEDAARKDILPHNMREDMERAAMVLESIRRNDTDFEKKLKENLLSDGPIAGHHG